MRKPLYAAVLAASLGMNAYLASGDHVNAGLENHVFVKSGTTACTPAQRQALAPLLVDAVLAPLNTEYGIQLSPGDLRPVNRIELTIEIGVPTGPTGVPQAGQPSCRLAQQVWARKNTSLADPGE